jgi:hypothetical protein
MARGDALEIMVQAAVTTLVQSGRLGLVSEHCRVFRKKGYYSKDRQKESIGCPSWPGILGS